MTSFLRRHKVDELEKALTEAGKEFEFHSFEGAGHAFFSVDRPELSPRGGEGSLEAHLVVLRAPSGPERTDPDHPTDH